MKTMIKLKIVLIILSLSVLAACFEPDEPVAPHVPGDEMSYEFENSIYTTQAFFDLGTNEVVAENSNSAWIIRFGSQAGDNHIGVNSAGYWAVYNSGTANPDSVPENPAVKDWIFDSSSGDPDSTAFAGWVRFSGEDTLYSHNVYLLGRYDGIDYTPAYALQLLSVNESGYVFRMTDWPLSTWNEYEVPKDPSFNYRYLSAGGGGELLHTEPGRDLWDLQFTQYATILYTEEGIPTPYYVRGVLLNRNGVAAALDTVNSFPDITFGDISGYTFSTRQDVIGYDWKSVEVDVNSNTAVYTVNADYTYIIRDTEGFYHKLRFIRFYNDLGVKGYPVIEHSRL